MEEVSKPQPSIHKTIIYASLIIAVGVFLGLNGIGNQMSFDGQFESCVREMQSKKILDALGMKYLENQSNDSIYSFAVKACVRFHESGLGEANQ